MHYIYTLYNYKWAHNDDASTIELEEQKREKATTLTLNVLTLKLRHLTESKTHKVAARVCV